MIARCIDPKPENDNYARLAKYIADAPHKGEKCLLIWTAGCAADQDYDLAISEVMATQDLNTRSQREKTYHILAKALGFEEHQRHCGVYLRTDTGYVHMHVAYNIIDKEKNTSKSPYYSYFKQDEACREMEKNTVW